MSLVLLAFTFLVTSFIAMVVFGVGDGYATIIRLVVTALVGLYFLGLVIQHYERQSSAASVVIQTSSRSIPQWVKIAVATRDEGKCRVCGSAYDLQYDHIIPYSLGGSSTDVVNIQLLCGRCNRRKGNRYAG